MTSYRNRGSGDEAALLFAELPAPASGNADALAAWVPALLAMTPDDARVLIEALYFGYVHGRLREALLGCDEVTTIRAFGRVLRDLPEELLRGCVYDAMHESPEDVRRWTWTPEWSLLSQDEDLMVMEDALIPVLFEEAGAGCTKSDYVAGIAAHHARDQAHGALLRGPDALAATLARAGEWSKLAFDAGASKEASYLTRLAGYRVPEQVGVEEVAQRVFDLRRCHADLRNTPTVRTVGDVYEALLVESPWRRTLHVERATGRMWATDERPASAS
ncbi:MAG: hypothetical protein KC593_05030 [Myxococcales bacterium]|nr:hypothetical protein [Myxococcales bacterium]MCB9630151.1 hypothetical protein [Sandaracinaceae bacterium]